MNKDSRIFVAGHNGLVGSAIVRTLKERGYKNIITKSRQECNLIDPLEVKKLFEENRIDYVFDAAARVGGIYANDTYSADFIYENTMIQTNLIHYAYKYFVKKFLFLGSVCIYPKFAPTPVSEKELLCGELEPTNDAYAVAKIAGLRMARAYRQQYGFNAISLMPTNLYGPGDNFHPENSHVMPALIRRFHEAEKSDAPKVTCWGDGSAMREFLHVDDLAEACIFALESWDPNDKNAPLDENGEPLNWLNVGSGIDLSIKKLANMISEITSYKGEIYWDKSKPDGTFQKLLNVSRLNNLGWKSKISLSEGLNITYEDYKKELFKKQLRTK